MDKGNWSPQTFSGLKECNRADDNDEDDVDDVDCDGDDDDV